MPLPRGVSVAVPTSSPCTFFRFTVVFCPALPGDLALVPFAHPQGTAARTTATTAARIPFFIGLLPSLSELRGEVESATVRSRSPKRAQQRQRRCLAGAWPSKMLAELYSAAPHWARRTRSPRCRRPSAPEPG